ncbi:PAS domain S-box protein [bacterium]|nr:PAS domain S-box protein [bacterium]
MESTENWQYVILEDIASRAPLDTVLPKLAHMLEGLLPGSRASILVLEGDRLRVAAAPSLPEFYNRAIDGVQIGPSVGSCGTAAFSARPVIVSNIQTDPLWEGYRNLAEEAGLRACWSTPILSQSQVLGTFAVYLPQPAEPDPEFLVWMQRAQHLACLALESERAVRQLRDSEERYRTLVDHAKDGMFLFDANLIVVDVNRSACDSLQYSAEELIGGTIAKFDPYFDFQSLSPDVIARKEAGQEFRFESRHRRRDGTSFPVEVRGLPFQNHGEERVLTLVSDISERRQAQAALERQRRLLLEAQEIAGMGHFEINLQTRQVTWSESLCRIYGLKPFDHQTDEETFFAPLHPNDREVVERAIEKSLQDRAPFRIRERIIRPDSQMRVLETNCKVDCDDHGSPTHLIGACLDITERLETELALQRANEIAQLTEWVYDVHSQTFFLQTGASFLLERFERNIHPADLEMVRQAWRKTLSEGVPYDVQNRMLREGRVSWIRACANPILGVTGRVERVSGVTQDITVQRQLEEQLRESQKMEAVGRLAGGVAHDFNNLLTVIQGYTMLLETDHDAETSQEAIQSIRQASDRAAALTSQLLAFSRRTFVEPQIIDIHPLIQRSNNIIRSLLGENIHCQVQLATEPCIIRIDPSQFEQVLINLVVNARDAMPQGGMLTIQTSRDESSVSITVADQGHGMDSEVLEHIFEPFFTTKALGSGTGLGLAVVHGVVSRWGGAIQVESIPGAGTSFRLTFELVTNHPPSLPAEPPPEAVGGVETILWVEDEPAVRDIARQALEGFGYKVLCSTQASEASLVDPAAVDLLLTDVIMPTMSGTELACRLRQARPDLPVLYVSGYTDDRIPWENLQPGRDAFLQKPFTPAALARKVRQLLDEKKATAIDKCRLPSCSTEASGCS